MVVIVAGYTLITPPTHRYLKTFNVTIDTKSETQTRGCQRLIRCSIHLFICIGLTAARDQGRVNFLTLRFWL
ncbi:hypothetical protein D3C81_1318540 [compost metagenome]